MRARVSDHETLLEIGLVVLGGVLLIGMIALLVGRTVGGVRRRAGHAEAPPPPGSIPAERHLNIRTVAAR